MRTYQCASRSTCFSILAYFATGLNPLAANFFIFLACMFALLVFGESIALLVAAIFFDIGMATTVASVCMSVFNIMSGFFRSGATVPEIVKIVNYILPTKYAAEVMSINEFQGLTFNCPGSQALADGACQFSTGTQVLETYAFDVSKLWVDFGIMFGLTICVRFISFLVLHYRKVNIS